MNKINWDQEKITCGMVLDGCRQDLRRLELDHELDYFSAMYGYESNKLFPTGFKWLAVYAVAGGSEGHYVHVDIIMPYEDGGDLKPSRTVLLAKTLLNGLGGSRYAYQVAEALARYLGSVD
jgi:hypothetical protein